MNKFATQFSTSRVDAEIQRENELGQDGEFSAMWGSEAGFGSLVKGHSFGVPAVPDVRRVYRYWNAELHI